MAKAKRIYVCQSCGNESVRWMGQCSSCGLWNTLVEEVREPVGRGRSATAAVAPRSRPTRLQDVELEEQPRMISGIGEFDRVMGGGIMRGSLVLIAGDPGIGKSTLMTELVRYFPEARLLYVTGEESIRQVKLRARRLGVESDELFLLAASNLEDILAAIAEVKPDAVVIDSIQTVYRPEVPSAPGSVSQVRESTAALLDVTKRKGFTTFLVGHVTKDGAIAGPRVLEHMVDTVLYFEGERHHEYRILRTVKNRFGSTNEIGLFEMHPQGLREVADPSEVFIGQRSRPVSGSTIVCAIEGTRPLLVEIQALVSPTSYGTPQRTASGFDGRRLQMLLAVLEKRVGDQVSSQDVFINVAGGVRLEEPAVDLGVITSIASSFRGIPTDPLVVVAGEVGLGGEIRSVSHVDRRLSEAARLGLKRAIMPKGAAEGARVPDGLEVVGVTNLDEALEALL